MREDAPALRAFERNAFKGVGVGTGDAVVVSEGAIQISELAVDEIEKIAIFVENFPDEELRLPAHRGENFIVHHGELQSVGLLAIESADIEPLESEIVHQVRGFGIVQHSLHLGSANGGIGQLMLSGEPQELIVRHAAPEKVRKPGCELVVIEVVSRDACDVVALDPEQEGRGNENRLQRDADGFFKRVTLLLDQ